MIIVVDPDQWFRSQLADRLGRGSLPHAAQLSELDRALAERPETVEVAILGPNLPPGEALRAAASLQVQAPSVNVILIARELSSEIFRQALHSGVRDVLDVSFTGEQIRAAVDRARDLSRQLRGRAGSPEAARRGPSKVVTVFSSKGGCGKSVVASNLAVLLAERSGHKVALVDLDLQSGDLAVMLGLLPAWTIYDASEHIERLDAEALGGYLTQHRSNVALLAAPLEPSLAEAISAEAVHRILDILKEGFTHIVVDSPAYFTDQVLSALDVTDECVLVGSLDVPSIKSLKLSLQTLGRLGFPRDRMKVVLNRSDSKVGLNVGEIEKTLGTKIDVAIPSSREVPVSVNQGVPLAADSKKSAVVSALAGLAEMIRIPDDHKSTKRRSLLPRGQRP